MKVMFKMPPQLKQMLEDYAQLEREGIGDIAEEMITAGADVAVEGMRRRVPVRTGNLKSHIKRSEIMRFGNVSFAQVGLVDAPPEVVRYGLAQEFGAGKWIRVTEKYKRSKKGRTFTRRIRTGDMNKAHSYIRATLLEDKSKINKAMKEVLQKRMGG